MQQPTSDTHAHETETDADARPDRREQPRYELSLAITIEGENNFYAGLSENMSQAGVFIATVHILPIGTPVVLSFTLPGEETIRVGGVVQWVRAPEALTSPGHVFAHDATNYMVKPGVGIRFTEMNASAQRAILAFMARRDPEFFD